MWIILDNKNAMSCLPKVGSHSLRSIIKSPPVDNSEVLDIPVRVGWVRHWQKRLTSAYSFYRALVESGSSIGDIPVDTYQAFIDHTLNTKGDHWDSQVELLTYNGVFLPTICHRFEDINEIWGQYRTGFIPHINGCVHETVPEYREDELKSKYKLDEILWSGL